LRLFLPEIWTNDEMRLAKAGVPEDRRAYRTKPEIALEEIGRLRVAGARFGYVLADAGYGLSASFRQALGARGLAWAVGIPRTQKVYPADVTMIFPVSGRGRPRKNHVPDTASVPAGSMLAAASWHELSWRRGTKGKLAARFAAIRVRVADGPPQRIGSMGAQHLPGEEVWLVGEQRSSGERKYYLANLPPDAALKRLAGVIRARWVCEQAHQQMKEELGLDHFEGRSWQGLHRHALMSMIAFLFLQSRRLTEAKRGKKNRPKIAVRTTAAEPADRPRHTHPGVRPPAADLLPELPLPLPPPLPKSAKVVLGREPISRNDRNGVDCCQAAYEFRLGKAAVQITNSLWLPPH
jgi:SRSO17 transposase